MFVCMDANFQLKNQLVSNYSQDPGLGIGWAYMVPRVLYKKYILSWANDDDVCTYLFNVIVTESIPRLVLALASRRSSRPSSLWQVYVPLGLIWLSVGGLR